MPPHPDYRHHGFIPQRQRGFLIMRIRNRAGSMTADSLRQAADLAERFGTGQVHLTTRQAVEIPGVRIERFEEALQAVLDCGLLPAVCGPRVRPVTACPGTDTCTYGLTETRKAAEVLDEKFAGREMPAKLKCAVCGCANSCTRPQDSDIGFRGAVEPLIDHEACVRCGACVRRCPAACMTIEYDVLHIDTEKCLACGVCLRVCAKKALRPGRQGYHIYVGGKGGRYPVAGKLLIHFVPEAHVVLSMEAIVKTYQERAEKGERLSGVLKREGYDAFKEGVERHLP